MFGGVLLGVPHYIQVYLRFGHTPCWPMHWWSSVGRHCAVFYERHLCAVFPTFTQAPWQSRISYVFPVPTHRSECHSAHVDLFFEGVKLRCFGWLDSPPTIGLDGHKMWTCLGRIITVIRSCRSECHSVYRGGGWTNDQGREHRE
jgi:hypothetical protein